MRFSLEFRVPNYEIRVGTTLRSHIPAAAEGMTRLLAFAQQTRLLRVNELKRSALASEDGVRPCGYLI